MSLIHDAIKMAQRERAGRTQPTKDPQPLIEGFFPYVSSAPSSSRSRMVPVIGISAGAVVLIAIAAYVAWPTLTKSRNPAALSPITRPGPGRVAQAPAVTDTAAVVTDPQVVATTAPVTEAAPPEVPVAPPQQRTQASSNRVAVQTAGVGSAPVRIDSSVSVAGDGVARAPANPRPEVAPRVDYEAQATALFNAGDLSGAREKFELATRFAPSARAWTNYGVTLQRLGNLNAAAAAYQSAIGIDANYLEAWLYQGRLAIELNDVARAIPLLQRARAINPRNADVNVELARLENEAHNWTEVKRFAEEVVRADAANYRGQWYLAVSSDELKDAETAVRAYTAYLQLVSGTEREQAQFVGYARQRLAVLRGKP